MFGNININKVNNENESKDIEKKNIIDAIIDEINKYEEDLKIKKQEKLEEEKEAVIKLIIGLVNKLKNKEEGKDPMEVAKEYDTNEINNKFDALVEDLGQEKTNEQCFNVLNNLFKIADNFNEYYKYFYNKKFVFCHSYGKFFVFLNSNLPGKYDTMDESMKDEIKEKYPKMLEQMREINNIYAESFEGDANTQSASIQCIENWFVKAFN